VKVLALDTATKTGWAAGEKHGVKEFPLRRGSSPGCRFLEFRLWLKDLIQTIRPDVVVYEVAHQRGGAATELCVGFTTRVMEEAAAAGLEYRGCHSRMLKAFATGNGNADKGLMMAAARERFPDVALIDDNHSDALLLHAWAEAGFPDVVAERKAQEQAAIAARKQERASKATTKATTRTKTSRSQRAGEGVGRADG
jgi:Holliday junction resolvasome RuvABC endonuclease subunit